MKTFETLKSENFDISKVSEDIKKVLNPLSQNPFLNGQLLEDVTLSASSTNSIEHKLGRKLRFWSIVRGPVVSSTNVFQNTNWTQYTPTFNNFTVGNGTVRFFYKIENDSLQIKGRIALGSTSSVTGQFLCNFIPVAGMTIDITKTPYSTIGYQRIGYASIYDAGVTSIMEILQNATSLTQFYIAGKNGTTVIDPLNNASFAWNAGDEIIISFLEIPITGYQTYIPKDVWEVSSDFPEKFLNLKSTTDCTVSLYVG